MTVYSSRQVLQMSVISSCLAFLQLRFWCTLRHCRFQSRAYFQWDFVCLERFIYIWRFHEMLIFVQFVIQGFSFVVKSRASSISVRDVNRYLRSIETFCSSISTSTEEHIFIGIKYFELCFDGRLIFIHYIVG